MSDIFAGRRVLIVEDESLVAMLLETILADLGCDVVGPESNIEDGLSAVADVAGLDAALLDVNVAGREIFPVAEALTLAGSLWLKLGDNVNLVPEAAERLFGVLLPCGDRLRHAVRRNAPNLHGKDADQQILVPACIHQQSTSGEIIIVCVFCPHPNG